VTRRLEPEVIVVGAGPAGMVAALQSSRHCRTTLIARQLPSPDEPPRVEAVPASFLALLIELGVHPREAGVEHLHESRVIAWEQQAPVETRGSVEAHVERPALDLALMNAVVASGRVRLAAAEHGAVKALVAARTPGLRVIDASGRAAVSARSRIHPPRPWAARTFWTPVGACRTGTSLRIAALPGGFVYRLGASRSVVLGIVGRKETIVGHPRALARRLHGCGADWVLDGLPSMAALMPGRISPASVQWTAGSVAMTVGDASLARDTLSSQGLAAGVSEAMYAAASRSADDEALHNLRKIEQRLAHLKSLERLMTRCRFGHNDAWREYATFVQEHLRDHQPASRVALRRNQVAAI